MKPPAVRRSHLAAPLAFTLIEVLVASTVFVLLIALLSQVVVSSSQTAIRENAKMDVLSDARQALDTFAIDWNARVRRPDVNMQATADPTTKIVNTFTFLTQVRRYSGTRQLATVSYQVDPGSDKLMRGILGYNWLSADPTPDSNPTMVYPAAASPTPVATPVTPAAKDYEVVSDNGFHLAISFLTAKGFSMDPTLATSPSLQGVVVTLAVLDPASRPLVTPAQFVTLSAALDQGSKTVPTDVNGNVSPLTIWQQNLNSQAFAGTANVSPRVAASIRIYQRVFYMQE